MNKNLEDNPAELVSVIIPAWNREKDLKEALLNLQKQNYHPIEIIVVDNNSENNVVSMVRENFPRVKLIQLTKNIGMVAVNTGIRRAKGRYLYLSDDDAYPEVDAISLAVDRFRENKDLGICVFRTIDQQSGFCPELRFEKGKTTEEKKRGIKVRKFRGCGVMIRTEMMEEIGGFPGGYFWCGEEADIAMRIIHAGYEVRYFPELTVHHMVSPLNRSAARRMYYETRNLLWLYWKYSPVFMAFLKSIYTLVDLGIKSLINKSIPYFLKGLFDGLKRLPIVLRQRQVVHTQTVRFQLREMMSKWMKRL